MKKIKLLSLLISLLLVFGFAAYGWADDYGVMRPDRETRLKWFKAYEHAPRAYVDPDLASRIAPRGSYSLLSHLNYVPTQRNQGYCGNCWAWAGTGVMEIALDVQESTFDRLSVQYINSCETIAMGKTCCDGGWLYHVADFYSTAGYEQALPWSNTNAHWQDGDASCDTSCASISTSPNYPITSINEVTIDTHGVGPETAIANIKNILHQNKAVWFAFFMPTNADGNVFQNWWSTNSESELFNMDYTCGHVWNNGWGHAVLCVGYNEDNSENSYWIMVNSWGADADRPNGIFHLDMNMNYDCYYEDYLGYWYSLYWQTLDIDYNIDEDPCECDLNHDGVCDMQDWLLFGQDWGRTDCPGAN